MIHGSRQPLLLTPICLCETLIMLSWFYPIETSNILINHPTRLFIEKLPCENCLRTRDVVHVSYQDTPNQLDIIRAVTGPLSVYWIKFARCNATMALRYQRTIWEGLVLPTTRKVQATKPLAQSTTPLLRNFWRPTLMKSTPYIPYALVFNLLSTRFRTPAPNSLSKLFWLNFHRKFN